MITDWDDAYSNGAYIAQAETYPALWANRAAQFRATAHAELDVAYGVGERERLDLFYPAGEPKGVLVFVHGGYWLAFDKSTWSHLAAGAVAQGWVVALPSYPLAPTVHIRDMTACIGRAINFVAGKVAGKMVLAGHSAGGHLVTRMLCADSPLTVAVRERLQRVVSISGLHDLRPLLRTRMNLKWGMDAAEAVAESPALHEPLPHVAITCWVGANERPEFLRQNDLLAIIWAGFGVNVQTHHEPGRHHFDVITDLAEPESALVKCLVGG